MKKLAARQKEWDQFPQNHKNATTRPGSEKK